MGDRSFQQERAGIKPLYLGEEVEIFTCHLGDGEC